MAQDTRIATGDTVALRADKTLIGVVERTPFDYDSHQIPLDHLILLHAWVGEGIRDEFLGSGIPPRDYIFVKWSREEEGSSLVAEKDVILWSRGFVIGDIVKIATGKDNAQVGTVVNIVDRYTIEPICSPVQGFEHLSFDFTDEEGSLPEPLPCDPSCSPALPPHIFHRRPHDLIYNVPGSELKRSQDYLEADHVLYRDWLGVVTGVDIDVALLLGDKSVVWVEKPWELYIVLRRQRADVVAVPEKYGDIRTPDSDLTQYSGTAAIPPEQIYCGQLLLTNQRNLEKGRWLTGRFDPAVQPVGRVVDVRTRRVDVHWLCQNPFAEQVFGARGPVSRPPPRLHPYDNLSSFRNPRDLRRNKELTLYDPDKLSTYTQIRGEKETPTLEPKRVISVGKDFRVGEQVRWKDQTAARGKYQETMRDSHGTFRHIPREDAFDFDLNEFKVVYARHEITVQWQDQSTSTHSSTQLRTMLPLEPPLCPGDIVTAREGTKMIRKENGFEVVSDFNEMQAFEFKYSLRPERVGIIQSVNVQEKVAKIKWFNNPRIQIMDSDSKLSSESSLGAVEEATEDISLYEIMTHEAFDCRRGDMVIIPTLTITRGYFQALIYLYSESVPAFAVARVLSQLEGISAGTYQAELQHLVKRIANNIIESTPTPQALPDRLASPPLDWIGEIVDIGLDGYATIRLGAAEGFQDVLVHRDNILVTVDSETVDDLAELTDTSWDPTSIEEDDYMTDSEPPSPIDEVIEYDGGERMDQDSDDQGWSTDEETTEPRLEETTATTEDIEMSGTDLIRGPQNSPTPISAPKRRHEATPLTAPRTAASAVDGSVVSSTSVPPTLDVLASDSKIPSQQITAGPSQTVTVSSLYKHLPKTLPPSFEILSDLPPSDQYRVSQSPNVSTNLLKRLNREHRILASSLPEGEIYVRTYESRLDLLRCLIIGPEDTPYEHAPFLVDLHLGPKFPTEPPTAYFHSWTHGLGRINPNLYEEGKICLSLLGTWQGKNEKEGWSDKATVLQILVSIQGLVFTNEPYYNEAGFETMRMERADLSEAMQYSEKAFVMARGFAKYALKSPIQGFEDVLAWLYTPLGSEPDLVARDKRDLLLKIIARSNSLMARSEATGSQERDVLVDGSGDRTSSTGAFMRPLSKGAVVMLRRILKELDEVLQSLLNQANEADDLRR